MAELTNPSGGLDGIFGRLVTIRFIVKQALSSALYRQLREKPVSDAVGHLRSPHLFG